MTNLLTILTNVATLTTFKDISDWTWSEVAAMLGVFTVIGTGFIKIIRRTDEQLKLRVDLLDAELKDKYKECKDQIAAVEKRVSDDREKDVTSRDRAMEKIESRIEKLSDLIITLIERN